MTLSTAAAALSALTNDIESYMKTLPPCDRYMPPIIDWHHPAEYCQQGVQGLSKYLSQVAKEKAIVDNLVASANPPEDYPTNLVSLQGVWEAFRRATPPLIGIWQVMDRRPGRSGGGDGATKVDVVARGGDEWIKVNTVKESRLLVEFREHDSYINSDYDSDSSGGPSIPPLTNSLLQQAEALVKAAKAHSRLSTLPAPRVKYVLTRLERSGHSDPRIGATLDAMRDLGIEIEFASEWGQPHPLSQLPPEPVPAHDIVLDLSVLIALCCDSTHHQLPIHNDEVETRFRAMNVDGSLASHSGASRDLRDQLRCEMQRPLILELDERLSKGGVAPRFWVTREVYDRFPSLVDVIGGVAERARAKALFDPTAGDFWSGSRWEGKAGCLSNIHVRVLEDADEDESAPKLQDPDTPFDELVTYVTTSMVAATDESPEPTPAPTPSVTPVPVRPPKADKVFRPPKPKRSSESRSPLRPGTVFPPASRLPSGHTLRTLLAGLERHATVLTNNRGAVLKVMREAGVAEGIPAADGEGETAQWARIWVVNPSSLAEWRRIEVEDNNERVKGLTNGHGQA